MLLPYLRITSCHKLSGFRDTNLRSPSPWLRSPGTRLSGSSAQGVTRLKSMLSCNCDSWPDEALSPSPGSQVVGRIHFLMATGLRCVFLLAVSQQPLSAQQPIAPNWQSLLLQHGVCLLEEASRSRFLTSSLMSNPFEEHT